MTYSNNASIFDGLDSSFEVPEEYGFFMHLLSDGSVSLETLPDRHYPHIHPNCYAPAEMHDVRLLHGGGSGTAVFGGDHPTLHAIVMKHGGPKDTQEVLSLATIHSELMQRRQLQCSSEANEAYKELQGRIPEFIGVYISRHHLRDRGNELWCSLRNLTYTPSGKRLCLLQQQSDADAEEEDRLSSSDLQKLAKLKPSSEPLNARTIRLQRNIDDASKCSWTVDKINVLIQLPKIQAPLEGDGIIAGANFVRAFGTELAKQQEKHSWKVTLMQKWIGGPDAVNGAVVLASGNLQGELLDTLIREFSTVMHALDQLTLPEERFSRWKMAQQELKALRISKDLRDVSKTVDGYVGGCILKNFHPDHGRFRNLRLVGEDIRDGELLLTGPEQVPAHFLGIIMEKHISMSEIFVEVTFEQFALDAMEDRGWLDILEHATHFQGDSLHSATDSLWTCGLTDAGLHNCFLTMDRGLEMFDLGEPVLQPRPAFLTKFLMSFFHILGMEDDGQGCWKNRFDVVEQNGTKRLVVNQETREKIPYLHHVFNATLDHFLLQFFQNDETVRTLILKYVVLQLLSDASFCLQRWEAKGGGAKRYGERSKDCLEKWLWRSLWDCYIATYVYSKLLLIAESQ
jgi:hypothetical protein